MGKKKKNVTEYRIGATPTAFTIEEKQTCKGKETWKTIKWFNRPEHLAIELRNMIARYRIGCGDEIVMAIREGNKQMIELLTPLSDIDVIELANEMWEKEDE